MESRPGGGRQLRRRHQGLHRRLPRRHAHGLRVQRPGERGDQADGGRDDEHHAGLQGRRHRAPHRLHLLRRHRQHRGAAEARLRPRQLERRRLLPARQDDRMDVLRVQVPGGEGGDVLRGGARAGLDQHHPDAGGRPVPERGHAAQPRHRARAPHGEPGALLHPEAGAARAPRRPLRRRGLPLRAPGRRGPLRLLLARRHHPRPRRHAQGEVPGVPRPGEVPRGGGRPPARALLVQEAPGPWLRVQVHGGGHVRRRHPDVPGQGPHPARHRRRRGRGRRLCRSAHTRRRPGCEGWRLAAYSIAPTTAKR